MNKIKIIESARGFAALYVFVHHIIMLFKLHELYPSFKYIFQLLGGYGHECVILFFLLSGFSIAYSCERKSLTTRKQVFEYYFARFRRIAPIFYIVLAFAIIEIFFLMWINPQLVNGFLGLRSIFGSALFISDVPLDSFSTSIVTNRPVWSLSYEIAYYLLFPLFVLLKNRFGIKVTISIVLLLSVCSVVIEYLIGSLLPLRILSLYGIWILGAYIANRRYHDQWFKIRKSTIAIVISCCLTLMVFGQRTQFLLDIPHIGEWNVAIVFCFAMIAFINKPSLNIIKLDYVKYILAGLIFLTPLFFIDVLNGSVFGFIATYVLYGTVLFVLASKFAIPILSMVLKLFFWFGRSSYGLYIVHWPILYVTISFTHIVHPILLILLSFVVVIPLAYWLEVKYHPFVANKMSIK